MELGRADLVNMPFHWGKSVSSSEVGTANMHFDLCGLARAPSSLYPLTTQITVNLVHMCVYKPFFLS